MSMQKILRRKKERVQIALSVLLIVVAAVLGVYSYIQSRAVPTVDIRPDNCYDKTINVVADIDYDPYSFIDSNGEMSGHDVELIYAIANEMRVNVNLRLMSWSDAMKSMDDGTADIILGLEYANEEAKAYNLTIPFNQDQFICFGRQNFDYINELEGKIIATLDENKNYDYLFSFARSIPCDSYSEAFYKLQHGQVDYVICRYAVGRRIIAKLDDNSIKPAGPTLINNQLCMGVTKSNPELAVQVNNALETLMNKGYNQELSEEWLGKYIQVIGVTDFIKKYSAFFILGLVLIILMIIWTLLAINKKMRDAKAMADLNEQCIELIARETKYAIFEWDIALNKMALAVNFQRFTGLLTSGVDDDRVFNEDSYIVNQIKESILNGISVNHERFRLIDEDNMPHWYEVTTTIIGADNMNSQIARSVGIVVDVNDRVARESKLRDKAEKDLLTGLYNKLTSEFLIRKALDEYENGALFIIDLDNLKGINDELGHLYGDIVIKKLATDLQRTFVQGDIIGRIGGDEFVAFISRDEFDFVNESARRICENYRSSINENNRTFETTASVGVAIRKDGESFESLFKRADDALYQIKKNSKNNYNISD